MNIVVLAGGLSPERDVSLTSGSLIANALMKRGHRVLLLDVYCGLPGEIADCASLFRTEGEYTHRVEKNLPDIRALKKKGGALVGENVEKLCRYADAVFNAMHGDMGEDGTLQSYLTCLGVRFTGTNALGAALSMDKALSKTLLSAAGIPTPPSLLLETNAEDIKTACKRVAETIGFPAVIKPNGCGSSVGVSIVGHEDELANALAACRSYDATVLAEKYVKGRELTVGILGGQVLPPVEIIPHEGFYDYKNKYQSGMTDELCPAPLTPAENEYLAKLTRAGFAALHLSGYARFDYLLDADGVAWCLEANALPGMTPTSLLPQMAAAVGISYGELCEKILSLAAEKN